MTDSTHGLRILVYAQHLSGVGHYVRTFEIARELAGHHEVYWVEGGRPVPHSTCPELKLVELPRIRRDSDGSIQGLDSDQNPDKLMRERAKLFLDQVQSIRPQVFLIEYFPFSKWELSDELLPAIAVVRELGGKVICSLRDVVRKTRFETVANDVYAESVTTLLNRHFDAVLVHADPSLTRLEDHFPDVASIKPPIHYTGLVSEKMRPSVGTAEYIAEVTVGRPFVLASAGGGAGGRRLIERLITAWQIPSFAGGRLLVVCAGLGWSEDLIRILEERSSSSNIVLLPFRSDFLHWLAAADLSISQCGYNTATNLLETGTPAIVCANPDMSDQLFRARRLAEFGLINLLGTEKGEGNELADAIQRIQNHPRAIHDINLDGAARTRELIEMGI